MFLGYALADAVETMSTLWCRPFSRPVLTVVLAVTTGVAVFTRLGGL